VRDGLWHHGVTIGDDDVDVCFLRRSLPAPTGAVIAAELTS
jgi:hypothetical protein